MLSFLLSTAFAYNGLNLKGVADLYRPQAQSCSSGWILHSKDKMFVRIFVGESEIYVLDWLEEMKLNYDRYLPKLDEELSIQLKHEIYNGSDRVYLGHIDNIGYVLNAKPYLAERAKQILPQIPNLFVDGAFEAPAPPAVHQINEKSWVISGTVRYTNGILDTEAPNTPDKLFFSALPSELCTFYPDGKHKEWLLDENKYIEKPLYLKHADVLKAMGTFEHLGLTAPSEQISKSEEEPSQTVVPAKEEVDRIKSLRFWLKTTPKDPPEAAENTSSVNE